jgi:hypothetical protein
MKSKNKLRLQQDKSRLSKQIGILPSEEPELITDRKEMRSKVCGRVRDSDDRRIGGWGECCCSIRTIFVDCSKTLEYKKDRHGNYVRRLSSFDPTTHGFRSEYVKQKRTYRSYLEVLAHELVHYRFAYLQHGKKFEQRAKEVLRGRTFEPKHVHLFAHHSKRYREGIDEQPTHLSLNYFLKSASQTM